jgi:Flp pilus assembly pilin Flp
MGPFFRLAGARAAGHVLFIRPSQRGGIVVRVAHLTAASRVASRAGQAGQGLAEYAMILAFIAMVAIAALTMLGGDLLATLTYIGSEIAGSQP